MARRRSTEPEAPADEVRTELADRYRDLAARYGHLAVSTVPGAVVPPGSDYFSRMADRLEAGEPVELYAAMLPRWLPGRRPRHGRVLLDRDGTIVAL